MLGLMYWLSQSIATDRAIRKCMSLILDHIHKLFKSSTIAPSLLAMHSEVSAWTGIGSAFAGLFRYLHLSFDAGAIGAAQYITLYCIIIYAALGSALQVSTSSVVGEHHPASSLDMASPLISTPGVAIINHTIPFNASSFISSSYRNYTALDTFTFAGQSSLFNMQPLGEGGLSTSNISLREQKLWQVCTALFDKRGLVLRTPA